MSNTISFLKNYVVFAYKIRSTTSRGYLKLMEEANEKDSKIYMLRIIEELAASTEDLFYWLTAAMLRNNKDKRYRDIWDFLHECDCKDIEVIEKIKIISKKSSIKGLLKTLNAPKPEDLSIFLKTNIEMINKLFENLFNASKASIHNRLIKRTLLTRVQNKIKHAMAVQEIPNGILIKDIKITPRNKEKRIGNIKHYVRNIEINLDKDRAKKIVETIESNGIAVQTLAFFIAYDLGEYVKKLKGKKISKKLRSFLEESLNTFSV